MLPWILPRAHISKIQCVYSLYHKKQDQYRVLSENYYEFFDILLENDYDEEIAEFGFGKNNELQAKSFCLQSGIKLSIVSAKR